jgi:DHA2 family multidrug resistance protein
MLATLMQALDSTIANVALPYMQGSLAASQEEVNWVLTSYIVAAAIMTAPTGYLAGRFGRTRIFLISVGGFTITSGLCGLAQSLDQIVVFRLLQGMFGASLVPLSQSVMFDIYPMERRGSAMALWGLGVQIGPVLGPILGGYLTENFSWRWVFYINLPLGLLASAILIFFLPETAPRKVGRLDWVGFGALSLAIGAFQLMLDRGETKDWFSSTEIILEACLAGVGAYVFLVQTSLAPRPFLSPRLFRDVNLVIGMVFIFIVGLVMYATLALLAPYLQNLMNYPVITAGVVLAPRGVGTMLAMLVCGRLLNRISARILVTLGFLFTILALYDMMYWTPDVSETAIVIVGVIQGFGVGFVFVPLTVIAFATLAPELRTEATGIFSLMRNLGSAIGISVTGALLQRNTEINHAFISGVVNPFNRALQSGAPAMFWNPATASGAAVLDATVTRQANIIAYVDDFKLMLLLSLVSLPLIFFIRKPARQALPIGGTAALDQRKLPS